MNNTEDYDNITSSNYTDILNEYDNFTFTNCTSFESDDNNIIFKYLLFSIPSSILLFSLISFMVYTLIKPLICNKRKYIQFIKYLYQKYTHYYICIYKIHFNK